MAIHITKLVGAKRKPKQAIHVPIKTLHTRSKLGTFFLKFIIYLSFLWLKINLTNKELAKLKKDSKNFHLNLVSMILDLINLSAALNYGLLIFKVHSGLDKKMSICCYK